MFIFGNFREHVTIWPRKAVDIDNGIFKLHYRLTFLFLLVCVVIISSREFVQEHISCISGLESLEGYINTFCFFSATFTVARLHNSSYAVGREVVGPGVGPPATGDSLKQHAYYQWVPFVLLVQALLFYLPHSLWKSLERGRLLAMVSRFNSLPLTAEEELTVAGQEVDSEEGKREKARQLAEVLQACARAGALRDWARGLVGCELLNAANVLLQLEAVDLFLGREFGALGWRWLAGEEVLDSVFPKLTKCTFHKYGPGGSLQAHDTLCVMALNVINEKVYVTLWFWLWALLWLTLAGLAWRLVTFLLHRSPPFSSLLGLPPYRIPFSDWLFLYYLSKNLDPAIYRLVHKKISSTFDTFKFSPTFSQQS